MVRPTGEPCPGPAETVSETGTATPPIESAPDRTGQLTATTHSASRGEPGGRRVRSTFEPVASLVCAPGGWREFDVIATVLKHCAT
jgi:hypothetical protein